MPTFDTNLQSISQTHLAPKAVDTVLGGNILAMRLLGNAKKWRGRQLERPVIVTEQTNGGSFSGMDQFNTNEVDTKVKLSFDLRGYQMPVTISGMERDVVASDENASVDMVVEAMEEAANSMASQIAGLFYGDGTGNSNKDFLGLAAIVDDGGEVATYGGQSRSTYTTLQANEYDVTGSITLSDLATADSAARKGTDRVTLNVTTETLWDGFEALIQPTINTNVMGDGYKQVTRTGVVPNQAALKGEVGFDALFFRGAPVVADEECASGKWYGLNENHLAFYGLKSSDKNYKEIQVGGNKEIDGVYSQSASKNMGFHFSGLIQPVNQYAEVGHFILLGNLVSFNPNRHFVINVS